MCAQCVLVATTLLHSDARFHSFLYTGSKTVRVNMESCYCGGMSTRLKQPAVTEFLSAENVTPAEIHRRLQAVYGENTVNRTARLVNNIGTTWFTFTKFNGPTIYCSSVNSVFTIHSL
jgi:hypothetical protein